MIVLGVDNGISGTIGAIFDDGSYEFFKTPIRTTISYTKKYQSVSRIDVPALRLLFDCYRDKEVKIFLERPMVNPAMFKATISAIRSLEATLITIEDYKFSLEYIDSKQWQKEILPSGIKGSTELKKASLEIGKRMFPKINWEKFKDADGILIALWGKKQNERMRG